MHRTGLPARSGPAQMSMVLSLRNPDLEKKNYPNEMSGEKVTTPCRISPGPQPDPLMSIWDNELQGRTFFSVIGLGPLPCACKGGPPAGTEKHLRCGYREHPEAGVVFGEQAWPRTGRRPPSLGRGWWELSGGDILPVLMAMNFTSL